MNMSTQFISAIPLASSALGGLAQTVVTTAIGQIINNELNLVHQLQTSTFGAMGTQMYNLLETQMVDASGMWRMSWDIMQNMEYLEENRLQDPPLPLFVESVSTPDVVLAQGDMVGQQTAHVEVRNDSHYSAQVTPTLEVLYHGEDMGTFSGAPVTIAAGATASLSVDYIAIASSYIGIDGYDVLVYLNAVDPATMSINQLGADLQPHVRRHRQRLGGLPSADRDAADGRHDSGRRRATHLLHRRRDHPEGPHLARSARWRQPRPGRIRRGGKSRRPDGHGRRRRGHDSRGQPTPAPIDDGEWIELDRAAGQTYQIEVHATLAPADTSFTVAILQSPDYPARLALSAGELDQTTNLADGPLESSIQVEECNGQHGISGLTATAGDLVDGDGHTISAGQIQLA